MKHFFVTLTLIVSVWLAIVAFFPEEGHAMPMFARRLGMSCSSCHMAWPALNTDGRNFKENGYKLDRDEEPDAVLSDFL